MNEVKVQRLDMSVQSDNTSSYELNQVRCELLLQCQSFDHAHFVAKKLKSIINTQIVDNDTGKYQGDFVDE